MNLLDVAAIIIIGWSVLSGLRTGLIAGVARIMGTITGIAAAYYWYRPLAWYLDENFGIGAKIASFLLDKLPLATFQGLVGGGFSNLSGTNTEISFLSNLAHQLALFSLEVMSFLVILLVVARVVARILKIISGITSGTPIGVLDRLAGLILGLARGVLIVFIMALLTQPLTTVSTLTNQGSSDAINHTAVKSNIMYYFTNTLDALDIHFSDLPLLIKPTVGKN